MTIDLATRRFGQGFPVFLTHGLLGQGRNWQVIGKRLAQGREMVLVDLRGHGASPHAAPVGYPEMAGDLARLAIQEGHGPAAFVGHSMGGKVVMALALSRPELVSALVVVDVAPVPYRHRSFAGYLQAMLAVDLGRIRRRADIDAALADADPDPRIRAFLGSNLQLTADGPRWLPDLGRLLEDLPAILDFPAALLEARYEGPVLFLCGAESPYVRPEHEPLIRRLFPAARILRIEGAGHWVHADRPAEVIDALDAFLPRGGPDGAGHPG